MFFDHRFQLFFVVVRVGESFYDYFFSSVFFLAVRVVFDFLCVEPVVHGYPLALRLAVDSPVALSVGAKFGVYLLHLFVESHTFDFVLL